VVGSQVVAVESCPEPDAEPVSPLLRARFKQLRSGRYHARFGPAGFGSGRSQRLLTNSVIWMHGARQYEGGPERRVRSLPRVRGSDASPTCRAKPPSSRRRYLVLWRPSASRSPLPLSRSPSSSRAFWRDSSGRAGVFEVARDAAMFAIALAVGRAYPANAGDHRVDPREHVATRRPGPRDPHASVRGAELALPALRTASPARRPRMRRSTRVRARSQNRRLP
jgi:hypothetical protein